MKYEVDKRSRSITPCPYANDDAEKVNVGSYECRECKYFSAIERKNKTVECFMETSTTYNIKP